MIKTLEQMINGHNAFVDIPIDAPDGTLQYVSVNYAGFVTYLIRSWQNCFYSDTNIMVIENNNGYVQ